jgi:hypothetical protein
MKADKNIVEAYKRTIRNMRKRYRNDYEHQHAAGDEYLCQLLIELGYGEVVKEYEKLGKY